MSPGPLLSRLDLYLHLYLAFSLYKIYLDISLFQAFTEIVERGRKIHEEYNWKWGRYLSARIFSSSDGTEG